MQGESQCKWPGAAMQPGRHLSRWHDAGAGGCVQHHRLTVEVVRIQVGDVTVLFLIIVGLFHVQVVRLRVLVCSTGTRRALQ